MDESAAIDSMDQVGSLGDGEDGNASLHRKFGLTMPTYSSNENRSVSSTNKGPYRSVLDFESTQELTKAMLDMGDGRDTAAHDPFLQQIANGGPIQTILSETEEEIVDALDWLLPTFDPECMEPQTIDEEVKRLTVLKSYLVLDQEREEAFDRITALAARIFDVPVAVINLIDLGRLWLLSTNGLGGIRECPRKVAFCAHTINCKEIVMVVPDAQLDFRFRENPVVTGPPHVRFYAGVALVSPEGYKLGDFCIWDAVPRPNGLTSEEQDTLHDMANMTVKVMVDRRYQLEKKKDEEEQQRQRQQRDEEKSAKRESGNGESLSVMAQDMMTLLSGLQLPLSLLQEDEQVQAVLGEQQLELINVAASNANIALRICRDTLVSMQAAHAPAALNTSALTKDSVLLVDPSSSNVKHTRISELVKSLRVVTASMDTEAPLLISADKSVPPVVCMDELKIFRSVLNLLESAIQRTTEGMIRFSIRAENGRVIFECLDTGRDIPKENHATLFLSSNTVPKMCGYEPVNSFSCDGAGGPQENLSTVAALVDSMEGGEYGFRPSDSGQSGSLLWISIPLEVPIETPGTAISDVDDYSSRKRSRSSLS